MTILSYKTIFGPTFSAILENLLELFFRNVPKTAILGKNGHFFAHWAKFGQNENFSQKLGRAIFLPLLNPNFMPSFGKILGAVSEINCVTKARTDEQRWNYRTGRFAGSIKRSTGSAKKKIHHKKSISLKLKTQLL